MGDPHSPLESALRSETDCVSVPELGALLEGSLDEARQQAVEAHLAACPTCRTERALLSEFAAARIKPEEAGAIEWITRRLRRQVPALWSIGGAIPAGRRLRWWAFILAYPWTRRAAVAFAVLAVVVFVSLYTGRNPDTPAGNEVPGLMRTEAVEVIAPVGDIPGPAMELRWQPVAGASEYRVRLLEVDRTEFWASATTSTRLILPQEVRRRIEPRKTILWEVTAYSADGQRIGFSGAQRFRILSSKE